MKKQFLAIIAVAGFVATASSQVTFGPMAGLNYSIVTVNVDEGDNPDPSSGVGFFIGGFVDIEVSEKFGIRPELHFSSRTTSDEYDILGTTVKSTASDSFLEIPILASIKPSENFHIHVGPSIGLLMGGKGTVDFDGAEVSVSGSDYTEGRNGFELGLAVGAAYELDGGLGFGARYTRGLTDLYEDTEGGSVNYNVIQVFASYALGK